jgi:hypothetical protein
MDGRATALRGSGRRRAPAPVRTARPAVPRRPPRAQRPATRRGATPPATSLPGWLRTQSINVTRHAAALRPFRRGEFGTGAAAPTEGHLQATNRLLASLRGTLLDLSGGVTDSARRASQQPSRPALSRVVAQKERAHAQVQAIERIWDFYFELFGQRQSQFADWLLSCDRIALDCYQQAYMGIAVPKSIPAPPPFSYMRTGFSPATFRRGIPLRRLGRQRNPFPLVQLPYHRLVNPWTLGAVLHEVSHNLQNDLGLQRTIPVTIGRELLAEGCSSSVASTWVRWNREIFADLLGLLFGGPAIAGSLMDVVGRGPVTTVRFSSRGPHPTPYLRTLISVDALRRMGFPEEAERYRRIWTSIYPSPRAGGIPADLLATFPAATQRVVDVICFRRHSELGGRSLAEAVRFGPKEQVLVEEAARRLAAGTDPGVVPERFLIGAARAALERRLARPNVITENFYRDLARR